MTEEYAGRAKFVTVYIEEAHPIEGWMYGSVTHLIHEHTKLEDRIYAAEILEEEFSAIYARNESLSGVNIPPVFVDGMQNTVSKSFGALPERLTIIVNGEMKFLGGKGPEDYSVDECQKALQQLLTKANISSP